MKTAADSGSQSGLELVRPDATEFVWLAIGLAMLGLVITALVRSARRNQWGWFFACLVFPLVAPAYLLHAALVGADPLGRQAQPPDPPTA